MKIECMNINKDVFLKVDDVEPVYNDLPPFSCSGMPYLKGIKVWIGGDGHLFECNRYTIWHPDAAVEDGHRQAFSLVREIYKMTASERDEAFGEVVITDIVSKGSYDDLVKKIDAWKKTKAEIRVKDEVLTSSGVNFVVTKIFGPSGGKDTVLNGIKPSGSTVKGVLLTSVKKTGVHVDDLDAYLGV